MRKKLSHKHKRNLVGEPRKILGETWGGSRGCEENIRLILECLPKKTFVRQLWLSRSTQTVLSFNSLEDKLSLGNLGHKLNLKAEFNFLFFLYIGCQSLIQSSSLSRISSRILPPIGPEISNR